MRINELFHNLDCETILRILYCFDKQVREYENLIPLAKKLDKKRIQQLKNNIVFVIKILKDNYDLSGNNKFTRITNKYIQE